MFDQKVIVGNGIEASLTWDGRLWTISRDVREGAPWTLSSTSLRALVDHKFELARLFADTDPAIDDDARTAYHA